jgi:DNA-binding HxlR family transcriptional regulator
MAAALTMTGKLDPRDGWEATRCPVAGALDVVGNRSTLLVLREAFYGATKFDEFVRRSGISEPITAARLKELVAAGLMERRTYREAGQRTRMDYHLTDMGVDLFPAIAALFQWGNRWLDPAGAAFEHHACGAEVHTELRCSAGHQVEVADIDLVARPRTARSPGPAAG